MIQDVLTKRLFQVSDKGGTDKALDFDRDLLVRLLRGEEVLSA